MVRTYWLVPVFYEASGHLDLQPFARINQVEACRPRAMCISIVRRRPGNAQRAEAMASDPSPRSESRAALQLFGELPGKAGDLVELVERLKAADALAVREQTGRLGNREALRPQLLEADRVELDRARRLGSRGEGWGSGGLRLEGG
jgi:hypothetical protein